MPISWHFQYSWITVPSLLVSLGKNGMCCSLVLLGSSAIRNDESIFLTEFQQHIEVLTNMHDTISIKSRIAIMAARIFDKCLCQKPDVILV